MSLTMPRVSSGPGLYVSNGKCALFGASCPTCNGAGSNACNGCIMCSSSLGSPEAPICPCCIKGIVWSDVRLSLGLVPFCAPHREAARRIREYDLRRAPLAGHLGGRRRGGIVRADGQAQEHGPGHGRRVSGRQVPPALLLEPDVRRVLLGVRRGRGGRGRGRGWRGEEEDEEKGDGAAIHTDAGSDLYDCAAQVILAVHKALQDLKAATHDPLPCVQVPGPRGCA